MAIVPLGGVFQVYRVRSDELHSNEMVLVGEVATTDALQRIFLQGHFVFGINRSTSNLTIIDVKRPDAPAEVAVFNVGAVCKGLYAQGRFVFVAAVGGVKIVDISVPSAPVVVGSAS